MSDLNSNVMDWSDDMLREACALLEGWSDIAKRRFKDREWHLEESGELVGRPDHSLLSIHFPLIACPIPQYTASLNNIWPLQSATIQKCGDAYFGALRAVSSPLGRPVEIWESQKYGFTGLLKEEFTAYTQADARTRARAICLCRLDELKKHVFHRKENG